MGRWTQYDEDSYRLPEGVTRVAYDADSQQYTFRDQNGQIYKGEPGAEYGDLTPISSQPCHCDNDKRQKETLPDAKNAPKTFSDILPESLITSSDAIPPLHSHSTTSSQPSHLAGTTQLRQQFIDSVRRTALPKLQGVVHNVVKRSATMVRRTKEKVGEGEGYSKLPVIPGNDHVERNSVDVAAPKLGRSPSAVSACSKKSTTTSKSTSSTHS